MYQAPLAPLWVRIIFPIIEIVEIIAIYFGFHHLTSLPGWIAAGVCTWLLFFLKMTFVPLITVPLAIVGAFYVWKWPLVLAVLFFCYPYFYKWDFIRTHQNQLKKGIYTDLVLAISFCGLLSACAPSVMAIKSSCESQYHHFSSQVICVDDSLSKHVKYAQNPYIQNFVQKGYELDRLVADKKINEQQAKSAWSDVFIQQRNAYHQNQNQMANRQFVQSVLNDPSCQWNGTGYSPSTMAVLTPQAYQGQMRYCQQRQSAVTSAFDLDDECPCPNSRDHNGDLCGERSAYSRSGGKSGVCY